MISLDRKEAEEFYEVYRDVVAEYAQMVKNFKIISISKKYKFQIILQVDELSSGPSIVIELSKGGENLVQSFRQFCGPSDPKVASAIRPGTIRAKFGVNKVQNAIHCTDLETDGAFESNFMFKVL